MTVYLVIKVNLVHNLFLVYLSIYTYAYAGCISDSHPHRITSIKFHINTAVSPDDGHSHLNHAEIDKYTKNKLCTKLALFTRLYRDAQSTKHKKKKTVYVFWDVRQC